MEPSHPCLKVFLADDSAAIRQRVGALLTEAAMQVVGEAGTPRGCIDGILAAHPDVVVLDCQLLGGAGLEVLQAVRHSQPGVAFVVFSSNSASAYRKRYLAAGAHRFLDKATEFGELSQAVTRAGACIQHAT